jgi:hypothetical protein
MPNLRDGKVAATMDVERAAQLTISENAQVGPKVVRWAPFSPYGAGCAAPPAAVSGRPGVPGACKRRRAVVSAQKGPGWE